VVRPPVVVNGIESMLTANRCHESAFQLAQNNYRLSCCSGVDGSVEWRSNSKWIVHVHRTSVDSY
jgi:hypothetical protein